MEVMDAAKILSEYREACLFLTARDSRYRGEPSFVPHFHECKRPPHREVQGEVGSGIEIVRCWNVTPEDRVIFPELTDEQVWLWVTPLGMVLQMNEGEARAKMEDLRARRVQKCPRCDMELAMIRDDGPRLVRRGVNLAGLAWTCSNNHIVWIGGDDK